MDGGGSPSSQRRAAPSSSSSPVSNHAAAKAMNTRSGCGGHSVRSFRAPSDAAIDHPFR